MKSLSQEELNEVLTELRIDSGSDDPFFLKTCQNGGEENGKEITTGIH